MADLHHRPRSTLHAASKTSQTLDFIGYRGVCPQVFLKGMNDASAIGWRQSVKPIYISNFSIFISPQSLMIATFLTNGSEAE